MNTTERTARELASLFRMLQVISDADSIGRIYQMLLAFCTTWRTIGFERGILLLADGKNGVLKGHVAAEEMPLSADADRAHESQSSFEALAKNVFDNYEQIDSSDLTLKTRTFSVPLDWHRSAAVKAAISGYPVLAEGRMSEFSSDPFFQFFGTNCYVALPIKVDESIIGVLAADNAHTAREIRVEDVSLVYSLTQQAALAVERLLDSADSRRKFRVLRKIQDVLRNAESDSALGEALNLSLSMICRAAGGSGVFLKDLVRNRTSHIKAVDEYTVEVDQTDISVGDCFEHILDRAAGTMRPLRGDSQHALLTDTASATIRFFHACPLAASGDGLGALAVYVEKHEGNRRRTKFDIKNRTFIELCAGIIAERLNALHKEHRAERTEQMLEELRANLVREKESAKIGARAQEFYRDLKDELGDLRDLVYSRLPFEKRVTRAKGLLETIDETADEFDRELENTRLLLRVVDLGRLVEEVVRVWAPKVEEVGVEVTLRVPRKGPSLLMNGTNIRMALSSILSTLTSCVTGGDKVLVECSTTEDRATVLIADTGEGLPGNLLTRLFMPFGETEQANEHKGAMSLAGDIIQRHGGEITVKSSPSWKTVIYIAFPLAANRDRRSTRDDRRRRPSDRRTVEIS